MITEFGKGGRGLEAIGQSRWAHLHENPSGVLGLSRTVHHIKEKIVIRLPKTLTGPLTFERKCATESVLVMKMA